MPSFKSTTQVRGARAEDRALAHLRRQGLEPVVRNYRCKGGEIDLVMRAPDGTLVFVEVRQRSGRGFGGAAGGGALPGDAGAGAAVPLRRGGAGTGPAGLAAGRL